MPLSKVLPWALLALALAFIWNKSDHFHNFSFNQPNLPAEHSVIPPAAAPAGTQGSSELQGPVSYAHAVELAAPAVVNIYTTQTVRAAANPWLNDPVFRHFFGGGQPEQRTQSSLGSGVIVSTDGYILTNNHVVASADSIVVAIKDGRKIKAKVVGTDPDSDLAVIKVDLSGLPALPFRTTPTRVGDVVLAIGDPFGVGQTVTQGIISALGRQGLGINTYEDFIQTDAAINPGNSGGALVDVYGNLVGINSAIYSRSGGNMGIGFAIPVSLAKSVMTSIVSNGKVVRGWLGVEVRGGDDGADPTAPAGNADDKNVVVSGVMRDGPAGQAGIQPGDTLISINGSKIGSAGEVVQTIAGLKPGSDAKVTVNRKGRLIDTLVHIGERPPAPKDAQQQDEDPQQ
jgi:Do/DeqQ family serine protease